MKPIGHTVIRLEEATSTNTLALENEAYLGDHGLVLLARHQTAGRGRMGHGWVSLPGAQLQFTVVLHPVLPAGEVPVLALVAGLAVAQAMEDVLGLAPALKWPNDVLLDGRKVCGILVESRPGAGGTQRLVVGIGINCQGRAADFPPELRERLTTLAEATGAPVDSEALLQTVLARLETLYQRLAAGGRAEVLAQWRRRAPFAGRRVRFPAADGPREGQPCDLTSEGFLVVQTDDGARHVQVSGELEWLA